MFPGIIGELFANKHTKLSIDGKVLKRLLKESKQAFPCEFTALLAGKANLITRHFAAPSQKQHAFRWEGAALIDALRAMQEEKLVWLGVLHTHPSSPPIPSAADQREWHYPSLGYLILSLAHGTIRSEEPFSDKTEREDQHLLPFLKLYQMENGSFREREYQILDLSREM